MVKCSMFRCVPLLLSILLLTNSVNANLIVNGDFEYNDVKSNSWQWFTADKVDGWNGSTVEIWNKYLKMSAFTGSQFAELNAHGNNGNMFTLYQDMQTQKDTLYYLSFAYAARQSDKEAFQLQLLGDTGVFLDLLFEDHSVGKWSIFNTSFIATSANTIIKFTSVFPETGTVGNFLDDISVTSAPAKVSEPGMLVLVFTALCGFAVMLFRRNKRSSVKR